MSDGRNRFGLSDAQPFNLPGDDFRRSVHFHSLTGVAITRMWNGDWFYAVDPTAGAVTVTLPNLADEVGHHHIVKRVTSGANACKIVTADSTLDGSATHSIAAQYDVRVYFCDGAEYRSVLSPSQPRMGASGTASFTGAVTMASTLGVSATLSAGNIVSPGVIAAINGSNDARLTGDGGIEIAKSGGGAYIDFKDNAAEDFDARISQIGTTAGARVQAAGSATIWDVLASSSAFAGFIHTINSNTVAGTGYYFLVATSDTDGTPDNEFFVRGDGLVAGDGAAYNTPADYGGWRETFDGNPIKIGKTVVYVGDKVRAATPADDPRQVVGVVRPEEGAIATNAAITRWAGRYLKDPYGAYLIEQVEWIRWLESTPQPSAPDAFVGLRDVLASSHAGASVKPLQYMSRVRELPPEFVIPKDAEHFTAPERIQNPAFVRDIDPMTGMQRYTPRHERPEWVLVGMLGKVAVDHGQPVNDRWIKLRDITSEVEEWHIR